MHIQGGSLSNHVADLLLDRYDGGPAIWGYLEFLWQVADLVLELQRQVVYSLARVDA
jgi:hypothetical protein